MTFLKKGDKQILFNTLFIGTSLTILCNTLYKTINKTFSLFTPPFIHVHSKVKEREGKQKKKLYFYPVTFYDVAFKICNVRTCIYIK